MSLVLLGVWLGAVGCADLFRASRDETRGRARALGILAGTVVVVLGLLLVGIEPGPGIVVGVLLVVALVAWVEGSAEALRMEPRRSRRRSRTLAGAGVVLGVGTGLLGVGGIEGLIVWPAWLDGTVSQFWPAQDLIVSVGVALSVLATGNIAVRLLLDAAGVPASAFELRLRGGRAIGPLERLFIVGLGGLHAYTAVALVILAKVLLRLPELMTAQRDGRGDVAQYVLVGSFASWLVAMLGVGLIFLA